MAATAAGEIKEAYLALCEKNDSKPHPYVIQKLTEASTDVLMNTTDDLTLDLSGNGTLEDADRVGFSECNPYPNRLSIMDVENLCSILSHSTSLTSLDLRFNNLSDAVAPSIRELINFSTSMIQLDLMGNNLTARGVKQFALAVQDNKVLRSLRLTGNKIGNQGGMYIAQALQVNTQLRHVDLGDCDLEIESVIAMATVLSQNQRLRSVVLNRPLFFTHQEEGPVHMGLMLKANNNLTELHLAKFDIRDFGVERLCDGLYGNYSLKYLNISSNRLSRDGAKTLAKLLRHNTPLEVLDIGNNRIEAQGVSDIASSLAASNTKLKALVVTSNSISGAGLVSIAASMLVNKTLTNLYIWGNDIADVRACSAFGQLMTSERLLEKNTDVRPYVVNGRVHLAEVSHGLRRFYYWTPTHGPDVHGYTGPETYPCSVGDGFTEPGV